MTYTKTQLVTLWDHRVPVSQVALVWIECSLYTRERNEIPAQIRIIAPFFSWKKSASDPKSRSRFNSTGSIAMKKNTNIELIKSSLRKYGLKVSDLF